MPDIQKLLDTKQFYVAAWKVIDARPLGAAPDAETVRKVSEIAAMAISKGCLSELRKIMKAFEKWVDQETAESAVTTLSETTDIDPMPDEFNPAELA